VYTDCTPLVQISEHVHLSHTTHTHVDVHSLYTIPTFVHLYDSATTRHVYTYHTAHTHLYTYCA